jgi:hypothetical protein
VKREVCYSLLLVPCIVNESKGGRSLVCHAPDAAGHPDGVSTVTDAPPALRATSSAVPPPVSTENRLRPAENVAVHVLSSVAAFVALACAVLVPNGGPSKKLDLPLWVLAFAIALPLGTFLGARQDRRLAAIPQPITRWALAFGTSLLMFGLVLLRLLHTGSAQLTMLGLLAAAAYGVTELAARRPAIFGRLEARPAWAPVVVGASAIVIMIGLFLVTPTTRWALVIGRPFPPLVVVGVVLTAVLVLAGVALAAVLVLDRRTPRAWRRRLFDVGLCVVLAMVVFQVKLPTPLDHSVVVSVVHHDFYLGSVNDMAHGRTMLVDIWALYGVGVYYALLAALSVLPFNHGGLVLLLSTLMTAQYVLVYATLRTAVRSQALVIAAVGAAVMGNIFAAVDSYVVYPSIGPLRFGPPYLVVAAAVAAARWPQHARAMRAGQLIVIAIAAVWSFETFVYTAVTWFALAALLAFGRARVGLWVFVRELAAAAAVSVGAVLALTIGTRVVAGAWPNWGGYFAHVLLYSEGGYGLLPFDFWSPALLMAAVIFLSAVGVVSVARDERVQASGPVLAGLAGFTGFAMSSFTYYVNRSHPNALLVLIVPISALGCLWASIFLSQREQDRRAWRVVPVALALVAATSLTVFSFPFAVQKWHQTAFAQAVPFADGHLPGNGGSSLHTSVEDLLAARAFDDGIVDNGAALLQRYDPGDGPALVVVPHSTQTTEILLKVRRVNLLPISYPEEDSLFISRVWPRTAAAIDTVPDGTILLTSTLLPQTESYPPLPPILPRVLEKLHQRFDFQVLESAPDGLQVIRLHSRP